jgi:hypothetical protein
MRTLETIVAVLFLIGWVGGFCAGFYTVYHSLFAWFEPSHKCKVAIGRKAFFVCGLFAVLPTLTLFIAEWFMGRVLRN